MTHLMTLRGGTVLPGRRGLAPQAPAAGLNLSLWLHLLRNRVATQPDRPKLYGRSNVRSAGDGEESEIHDAPWDSRRTTERIALGNWPTHLPVKPDSRPLDVIISSFRSGLGHGQRSSKGRMRLPATRNSQQNLSPHGILNKTSGDAEFSVGTLATSESL